MDSTRGVAASGANGETLNIVAEETTTVQPNNDNVRNGTIHDRLFQTLLIKMALNYRQHVSYTCRRLIEFCILLMALSLFIFLVYVHVVFNRFPGSCLKEIRDKWPRKGVLRVEVIHNLEHLYSSRVEPPNCGYDLRSVLVEGPRALPSEMRRTAKISSREHIKINVLNENSDVNFQPTREQEIQYYADSLLVKLLKRIFSIFYGPLEWFEEEDEEPHDTPKSVEPKSELEEDANDQINEVSFVPAYIVEYSLYYGLLKLSPVMRREYGVPVMVVQEIDRAVQLDADSDECFGDWHNRFLIHHFVGFEEVVMSSLRSLAENDTEKGYLRDMISGEHYQFVTSESSRYTYINALCMMLVFTFAISMLLRFSHHQIFLFIIDLLQMFDLNQPLVFPVAPLLTVILALVGMEAIMSEVFSDTSAAFYMILLVWMADQYDAICCQSSISKRHWLKFFYLYHYAFYAYHYRYNGLYSGLALLTSSAFILHSMVFFLHHYELPLIAYQEQLRQVVSDVQHNTIDEAATLNVVVTLVEDPLNGTAGASTPSSTNNPTAGSGSTSGPEAANGPTNVTCMIRNYMRPSFGSRRLITQRLLLRNAPAVVPPPRGAELDNEQNQLRQAGHVTADQLVDNAMSSIFRNESSVDNSNSS